ncbi:MFS transporter [Antribacter gilvus]|uniref:MFS transporter n=1 Tax=Antribacter gilvus TaxID=2304675 RepID=UPI0013DF9FDD|nr:MFS transporter [Antribacter gilvus]
MSGRILERYVPRTRAGRLFVGIALVDSLGTGLYLAASAIFFVRSVGLTHTEVGIGLAVCGGAALLSTVPLGRACDRWGATRMLVLFQLWRAGAFTWLALVDGPVGFVLASAAVGLVDRVVSPASQAVVGLAVGDEDRTRTMSAMRAVRNIGFAVGSAVAAPVIATGSSDAFRALIVADAATFLVAALALAVLARSLPVVVRQPAGRASGGRPGRGGRQVGRWYLALTGLNGVLGVHMTLLSVGLPLWTMSGTAAPEYLVAGLLVANTVLVVTLQVPLSGIVERARGAERAWAFGGACVAGACVVAALAGVPSSAVVASALLVGTVVVLTFGEMWHSIAAWELSYRYAPPARRSEHLSVFALGPAVQEVVGPLVVTGVVLAAGWPGWVGLALVVALATGLVRPVLGRLDAAREPEPERAPDARAAAAEVS